MSVGEVGARDASTPWWRRPTRWGTRLGRRAVAEAAASGVTSLALRRLLADPPGGSATWDRTNHAGRTVSLVEGPAVAVGLVAGTLASGGRRSTRRASALTAVAAVGAYDDLAGATATKGLRGHLTALRHGEITSGAVKIGVIGAAGLLAASESHRVARARDLPGLVRDAALVAGTANLLNLLDLRPGRALKAAGVVALSPAGGPVWGAVSQALPADLAGETMLGDCGANALGAAVGLALVDDLAPWVRTGLLGGVVGLTLASERVSFSEVIDRHPLLSRIDAWGRTPAA